MTSRKRAIGELGVAILGVGLQVYGWKTFYDREEDDPRDAVAPLGVVLGAANLVAYLWAYDRDVWQLQTDRSRRLLYNVSLGILQQWGLKGERMQYSFGLGGLLGTIGYRLWYGVLNPVPNSE